MLPPDWLKAIREAANQAPRRARLPLFCGTHLVGSVEDGFLDQISEMSRWINNSLLQKSEHSWIIQGPATDSLNALAEGMRAAQLCGPWRNEQLAVLTSNGQRIGTVERGAVRPLGIATQAVHLVGKTPDGCLWVQQRSQSKANDPGLWDTLMGGMVGAQDTLQTALARETWEEAGLHIDQLQAVRHGGWVVIQRPSDDGQGSGYVQERIAWFECLVPKGLAPQNQDGEVERFECLSASELCQRLRANAFTLEASLILAAALGYSTQASA
jgi:8-oxo-dGTP pyrophosphatase MutT (NUDIX family)